jgi:putative CocE/NonD family hydrolase
MTSRCARLVMGPWHHHLGDRIVGQVDFGPEAVVDIRELELAFLDRHLRDGPVPEDDAPIRLFIMGVNEWRPESEWPLARAVETPLFLAAEGGLAVKPPPAEGQDAFDYDPANPVITTGGNHSLVHPAITVGPHDQRSVEARRDVLVYTGPSLEAPVEVTGPVSLSLFVSSSAPDTDFTARLVDVHPDGRAINLCEGVLRARYRESFEREVFMAPGKVYELTVDLGATSNVFLPGHRIRLDVSSSNFPRIDRNLNTGGRIGFETEWRVAHNIVHRSRRHPSRLRLPVVPDA